MDKKNNNTDKDKVVVLCQNCSQQLRVPKNKNILHITCPTCKYEFDYLFNNMKRCPHCGQYNLKQKVLCAKCGKMIKTETRLSRIITGTVYIIGGLLLIVLDTGWNYALGGFIAIPFVFSIIGVFVIFYGIIKIFNQAP